MPVFFVSWLWFVLPILFVIILASKCSNGHIFSVLFFWHGRLKFFDIYINDWYKLRLLLRNNKLRRLKSNLFYYDLSLNFLSSFIGLLYMFLHASFAVHGKGTENNHQIVQFYRKTLNSTSNKTALPTKWNFKSLASSPVIDCTDTNISEIIEKLEANYMQIAQEYYSSIHDKLVNHPDSKTEVNDGGTWEWSYLYGIMGLNKNVSVLCPQTTKIVNELPLNTTFGFVFFSVIKNGTVITPHYGSSNLRLRIQLCLDINENDAKSCQNYLWVADKKLYWRKGKAFIFDDSYLHGVEYYGKHERIVLILDIWHPQITQPEKKMLQSTVIRQFGKINNR